MLPPTAFFSVEFCLIRRLNKVILRPKPINTMHRDQQYVQALIDGDSRIIGKIYARHASKIKAWIEQNEGNAADAKDVMQDALIAITRQARKPGWKLTCPFGAFLFLVCKGKWFNELKRRKQTGVTKMTLKGLADENDASILAGEVLREEEKYNLFRQKFETLSEGCQKLLRLAWNGRQLQEVADEMNFSYGYVRKKKCECIARLMNAIQNAPEFHDLKSDEEKM